MPRSGRRGLPDNLDPLVDTLSNVVGILVVVLALTQLQIGDALQRVLEIESGAQAIPSAAEAESAEDRFSIAVAALGTAREAVTARSDADVRVTIAWARRLIAQLKATSPLDAKRTTASTLDLARLDRLSKTLQQEREALEIRREAETAVRSVPKELVARLPNPSVVRGREAWILCRYGRCYPADRPNLVKRGSSAIQAALGLRTGQSDGLRDFRMDEFEAVAHRLRKVDVGLGSFRWHLIPAKKPLARLVWRSPDTGLGIGQLAAGDSFRAWLAAREPAKDVITYLVWDDSFEVYLEARQTTEAAGFKASWRPMRHDEEFELILRFQVGAKAPLETSISVD